VNSVRTARSGFTSLNHSSVESKDLFLTYTLKFARRKRRPGGSIEPPGIAANGAAGYRRILTFHKIKAASNPAKRIRRLIRRIGNRMQAISA
jgi:hypothetical protein